MLTNSIQHYPTKIQHFHQLNSEMSYQESKRKNKQNITYQSKFVEIIADFCIPLQNPVYDEPHLC